MIVGLDIGTDAIRSAVDGADGPAIESVPAIVLPVTESTLESASLSPADGRLVEAGETTYVVGSDAAAVAETVDAEPQPLFSTERLASEGDIELALETIVDSVLTASSSDRLCYTLSGTPVDAEEPATSHRETIESVIADPDSTTPISKGFAVVYDQLEGDNFTGLGICIGAQVTSATLAYYGVPAMSVSIGTGSDWIVERAAGETGHDPAKVRDVLEAFDLDPDAATGGIERALAQAHDDFVGDLADAIREAADEGDVQQGLSVPIAVGGTGAVEGIEYLLGGRFDAANLPFSIRGVRRADDPATSAARGALAAARDDVDVDEDGLWSDPESNATSPASGDGKTGPSPPDTEAETVDVRVPGAAADDRQSRSFDTGCSADDAARADDAIEQLFDRLANRDDEIRSIDAAVDDLSESLGDLEDRTPSTDDVTALEERLDDLGDRAETLEERTAGFGERLSALESRPDETTLSAVTDDVESLEAAIESVRSDLEAVEGQLTEAATRDEEIDALRADIEEIRADAQSPTAIAAPIAAGGGAAGTVAGGVAATSGNGTIGAAAIGLGIVLLAVAVALAR
ncbi:hypothetical protein [Halopiger djelfimassiliensis]|uniref:hypothetical protein n=1 Tax=Halopiger djelfimassiliensis TaxID=1293047 RepID=UPI0006779D09|nr:hypothetical protein [Halopiger djelfimassiliensis]